MKELLEILGVFALSAVKFGVAGVPAAVFAKFSFFKAVTVTFSGGCAGAIIFTYLSDFAIRSFKKIKKNVLEKKARKPKKKFTTTNKIIVRTKQKLGLAGIAIITPLILSFPLGTFVAVRYYHNKQRIILYMAVSTMGWSILLYLFYNFFYEELAHYF